jgi:hypothetical protein
MRSATEIDLAVRNLAGRYCDAVARFDIEAFRSCWTDDADWVVPNVKTTSGRDAIVRLFATLRGGFRLCIQELLSGVVEPAGEGSAATARWQIRELQWRADGTTSCLIGIYTDRIVLDGGLWRFARRRFDALYRGPVDLSGAVLEPSDL